MTYAESQAKKQSSQASDASFVTAESPSPKMKNVVETTRTTDDWWHVFEKYRMQFEKIQ